MVCHRRTIGADSPEALGSWHTVYTIYNRWSKKGRWEAIFKTLSEASDFEYLMIDGSIVRLHQHGCSPKTTGRGGWKIKRRSEYQNHAAVDALGNPVRLRLTEGQASEYGQANALIEQIPADYICSGQGYDGDELINTLKRQVQ
ncbi:MAG: transposase [Nitrosomonas sp.]|nr:transposase [Nitrosomonas sp.]